jgi:hypothetical protein
MLVTLTASEARRLLIQMETSAWTKPQAWRHRMAALGEAQ